MSFSPYLAFPGTAREAFTFYQEVFGGELTIMDMSAMPPDAGASPVSSDAVMHASLTFGDNNLMGADGPPGVTQSGMCAMYQLSDDAEAERVFAALSQGGSVVMPIAETFFATRYGIVNDKFGTPWMIYAWSKAEPM